MDITKDEPRKDGMVYPNGFGDTYKSWVLTKGKKGRISKCDHCDMYGKPECRMAACHTIRDGQPIDGIWKFIKITKKNGTDGKE
jgi:hypothetical protein